MITLKMFFNFLPLPFKKSKSLHWPKAKKTKDNEYSEILEEIARLHKLEILELNRRLHLAIEKANTDEETLPYRFSIPRLNCGFIFIPLSRKDQFANNHYTLQFFTELHKYDQCLDKCIGVMVAPKKNGGYQLHWKLLHYPWREKNRQSRSHDPRNLLRPVAFKTLDYSDFIGDNIDPNPPSIMRKLRMEKRDIPILEHQEE